MTLTESYAWCMRVARRKAANFYPSFVLLNRPKHRAICAIYAFMRYCDDLSDKDGVRDRKGAIERWRADLEAALTGRPPAHRIWPAFLDAVTRYDIPHHYFFEMIEGVSSDLERRDIRTFEELCIYCYQVAGVVGMAIIHIYGLESRDLETARELAKKCGLAFQLTNILRDVREDLDRGRVYLPREDLMRFGVDSFAYNENFQRLMEFEADRARDYYTQSVPLVKLISRDSRPALKAIIGIYSRLLELIVESGYDVLSRRIRVSTAAKLRIVAHARLRQ